MDDPAILSGAERRVQEHRTAEASLRFVDKAGKPLAGVAAEVRLVRHEFKLGANAFRIGAIEDAALQAAYYERFAALLNYATLPFYWGGYEPEKGKTQEDRLDTMAEWCHSHRITAKGHPLVWHEVFPRWAEAMPDPGVLALQERRVKEIVYRFQGRIDLWDVVNEATVSARFDNAVGRWMKAQGAAKCVADALRWADGSNPKAVLLYNDFNVSPDFEKLVQALLDAKAPVRTLGIQSHMHKGTWPIERVWSVCDTYARFGLPLHFTEATVLSGDLKKPDDNDWHRRRDDWHSTPDGEKAQLDYGQQFYTVLFSHPAVEAVTWWDFSDNGAWQGAPAGLVRKDMAPKPLYDWLVEAFHARWTTNAKVTADAAGAAKLRCFFGDHEVRATLPSGAELKGRFALARRGGRTIEVTLA
ncbi:MAG TPA: endo-1,4-beta-xylanase [Planctomycetota bacterium]|nr:endo-1,4-beta-xylanase [Planctomycetota bacterium]